jgi:hypothetical protein
MASARFHEPPRVEVGSRRLARYSRRTLIALSVVVLLVTEARLALPHVVKRYVNPKLSGNPG